MLLLLLANKVNFAAVQYKSSRRGGDLMMMVVLLQIRVLDIDRLSLSISFVISFHDEDNTKLLKYDEKYSTFF